MTLIAPTISVIGLPLQRQLQRLALNPPSPRQEDHGLCAYDDSICHWRHTSRDQLSQWGIQRRSIEGCAVCSTTVRAIRPFASWRR